MALEDIVQVSISLETSAVSRAGFGIPIFISAHNWFTERVRTYTNLVGLEADIPAGSEEHTAASAFFSQSPAPSQIKVGRREVDLITFTPSAATATGQVYTITVVGTDDVAVVATFTTSTGSETAADIVTDLKADLSGIVGVTVAGTTTLTLSKSGSTAFSVNTLKRLADAYTVTETAAAGLSAIEAVDSDFYFITAHDHTEAYILSMAAAVEAKEKLYFVSSQDVNGLATLAVPATDTLGKLTDLNYFRTASMFHQTADTTFPECAFVGKGGPYEPGTITWANKQLAGVAFGINPTSLNVLSATELNNLQARNANVVIRTGGIPITREGRVVGGGSGLGEWIDVIRSRDLLIARIREAYQNKLINAPKVSYTDNGIAEMRGVLTTTLNRYVSTEASPNILRENDPYTTNFPRAADVSLAEKSASKLTGSFTAILAGAIHVVVVTGTLALVD